MAEAAEAGRSAASGGNVYCVVLTRREDLTREEFLRVWLIEHRELLNRLPGLMTARLLPVVNPSEGGPDGVGLLFFGNGQDLKVALASDEAKVLRAHTASFARSDQALRLILTDPLT